MNKFTEIRNEIFTKLDGYISNTNVFRSRLFGLPDLSKKSAICIFVTDETADYTESAEDIFRHPSVTVQFYVEGKDAAEVKNSLDPSVDDKLEVLLNEVESKLMGLPQTLNKKVNWLRYKGIKTNRLDESEKFILIANQLWGVRFNDSSPFDSTQPQSGS